MRIVLGCALVVLMACGATAADEKIDAKKLVGKWEPKGQKEGDFTIEFTKDGKVHIAVSQNGKEFKADGTYKVDGNKVTTTMNLGGKERSETHTITKLTDTELVSKDEKGKEETLVRKGKGKK
jgi:uncharacterized protein (TIGR03066 family)